ncbi:spermatogenesis-associated protein 22 [Engraulis encrasicolus]|uniref:spermatogenesis-associated protein 22 n=1 Tax=Engraulis encrasicolus TaxID=184585 RepID=UPI002FD1D5D4
MKRTDTYPRPTAGCLSVPLFNQRKRSRLPLTSTPVENEFCSAVDFDDQIDFADSSFSSGNAAYAAQNQNQRPAGPRPSAAAAQGGQWNRPMKQQPPQPSNPPVRHTGPVARGYAPLPHPHKPANTWSQQRAPGRQEAPAPNPPHSQGLGQIQSGPSYGRGRGLQPGQGRGAATGQQQSRLKPMNHQQLTVQQSFSRQQAQGPAGAMQGASGPSGGPRYCPAPVPAPPAPKPQSQQQAQWQFKVSPRMGQTKNNHNNSYVMQSTPQQARMGQPQNNSTTDFYGAQTTQPQEVPQSPKTKSESEKSLRILTCVIEGMRHWVQFKNKAPMLFEIFASLDSAVTDGKFGAKHFLLRTGRDVVQCVYYEHDQELPKLFRGLVHRCVGNYDQRGDVFTCVSVRLASRHEQKNSQEAIRASDEEMRQVVQSLNEI